jgi:NADPH2:quinone reductase
VQDDQAAALLVQGTTAWYLLRSCARLASGESVVVHSAAGGVGSIAVQLARRLGAGRVIAAASSDAKRAFALELGAHASIDAAPGEMAAAIVAANDGRRVNVVLDAVGGATFDASLAALAPFGRLVVYGIADRRQNEVQTGALLRGSHAVIGFWMAHALERPGMVGDALRELFELVAAGELRTPVGGTYPLAQAAQAHIDLAARRTTGKLVIDPWA